jgi:hypothetical protein
MLARSAEVLKQTSRSYIGLFEQKAATKSLKKGIYLSSFLLSAQYAEIRSNYFGGNMSLADFKKHRGLSDRTKARKMAVKESSSGEEPEYIRTLEYIDGAAEWAYYDSGLEFSSVAEAKQFLLEGLNGQHRV